MTRFDLEIFVKNKPILLHTGSTVQDLLIAPFSSAGLYAFGSRVCNEKFWTDTLVNNAHSFKSTLFDHYFPKTTQNFRSNAILFISISYMELKI